MKFEGLKTFKAAPEKLNSEEKVDRKSVRGDGVINERSGCKTRKVQHMNVIIKVVDVQLFRLTDFWLIFVLVSLTVADFKKAGRSYSILFVLRRTTLIRFKSP